MKKKKKTGKNYTLCKKCKNDLNENDLYCHSCGEPTIIFTQCLSAKNTWKETWSEFKDIKGDFYFFSIFFILVLIIPISFLIIITVPNFWLHQLTVLLTVPFLMIPFAINSKEYTVANYIQSLKKYPVFFVTVLVNQVYFLLIKVICTSLDPILNLVRLVLVLYWLAIVLPLPLLLLHKTLNPLKALLKAYKGGKETRWQQFFIVFYCFFINLFGLLPLGLGLLITVPYTFEVIKNYYSKMNELDLFSNDSEDEKRDQIN